jgi:hypothetical protein
VLLVERVCHTAGAWASWIWLRSPNRLWLSCALTERTFSAKPAGVICR